MQDEQGWWQGELETNVTMDAEDLLMREFLGAGDAAATAAEARWIRSQQRDDATWANFYGGPGDLSTSIEAYVALRLAGDEPSAPHMAPPGWILAQGGLEASRVFTRIWMAMFGEWPWDDLPVIPPELIYLPAWFPLNIYDWGCWARQTIVALAIVSSSARSASSIRHPGTTAHPRPCAPPPPNPRRPPPPTPAPAPASHPPSTKILGSSRPWSFLPTSRRALSSPPARAPSAALTPGRSLPPGPCGGPRCAAARTGSSPGRSGTAAGAASSRPGCTR